MYSVLLQNTCGHNALNFNFGNVWAGYVNARCNIPDHQATQGSAADAAVAVHSPSLSPQVEAGKVGVH